MIVAFGSAGAAAVVKRLKKVADAAKQAAAPESIEDQIPDVC